MRHPCCDLMLIMAVPPFRVPRRSHMCFLSDGAKCICVALVARKWCPVGCLCTLSVAVAIWFPHRVSSMCLASIFRIFVTTVFVPSVGHKWALTVYCRFGVCFPHCWDVFSRCASMLHVSNAVVFTNGGSIPLLGWNHPLYRTVVVERVGLFPVLVEWPPILPKGYKTVEFAGGVLILIVGEGVVLIFSWVESPVLPDGCGRTGGITSFYGGTGGSTSNRIFVQCREYSTLWTYLGDYNSNLMHTWIICNIMYRKTYHGYHKCHNYHYRNTCINPELQQI